MLKTRASGHYFVKGRSGEQTLMIALGDKYEDWVKSSGRGISTLSSGNSNAPGTQTVNYRKSIFADENWRPIFDREEHHRTKIREMLREQKRIGLRNNKRLEEQTQGQPAAKESRTDAGPSGTQPRS